MDFILQNKYIVIPVIAIVIFVVVWYFFFRQKDTKQLTNNIEEINDQTDDTQKDVILILSIKAENNTNKLIIYSDGTYDSLLNEDSNKTGLLTQQQFESLKYLIDNRDKFKESYCESTDDINYHINIFDKEINLGNFDESCMDTELHQHINTIVEVL